MLKPINHAYETRDDHHSRTQVTRLSIERENLLFELRAEKSLNPFCPVNASEEDPSFEQYLPREKKKFAICSKPDGAGTIIVRGIICVFIAGRKDA